MKRNGSITILVLITFSICIIIGYFTIEVIYTQSFLQLSNRDKIQCDLLSESKILRLLKDKNYFDTLLVPKIHEHFWNLNKDKFKVEFEENMDADDTYKEVNGRFFKEGGKQFVELNTKAVYKGFISDITAKASIINNIFELDKNPIIAYGLSNEMDKLLEEYLVQVDENISIDNLSVGIKGIYTYDHETIKIGKCSNNLKKVTKIRNDVETVETFDRDIFLVIKNELNIPTKLVIEDKIEFRGILYIEGDLIIESDFDFRGIIIQKCVNNNIIVHSDISNGNIKSPKISGIVLTEGDTAFSEFIDIKYESGYIYRYGIYLPGFLQPKIELIKKA